MVTLIDQYDHPIGAMAKMEAHEKGLLHRAFSVIIYNAEGEMLLQRRAHGKYHSGGLWTNACCGHPAPQEEVALSAVKRLREEMGIGAEIRPLMTLVYHACLDNGLQEHEYDHIFVGLSDEVPDPDPEEVREYKYMSMPQIQEDIQRHEEAYTEWFKLIIGKLTAVGYDRLTPALWKRLS